MDSRSAKLALARKKLKDHQDKKNILKDGELETIDDPMVYNVPKSENVLIHSNDTVDKKTENYNGMGEVATKSNKDMNEHYKRIESEVIVTEVLISHKRNLEVQVNELQCKLREIEQNYLMVMEANKIANGKIMDLENVLKSVYAKNQSTNDELLARDQQINELEVMRSNLAVEKNNLLEQLEVAKSVLNEKDSENMSLKSQLHSLQNNFDGLHLQLQQLTNGSLSCSTSNQIKVESENVEELLKKIVSLEQQTKFIQNEKQQLNVYYEHFTAELNDQLKTALNKNRELTEEIQNLSQREHSLIDQISDMEIRLQHLHPKQTSHSDVDVEKLQLNLKSSQDKLNEINNKYEGLRKKYLEVETQLKEMNERKNSEYNHNDISISKLNADITSDKIALQRASEQNKKLKSDLHSLEEDFIKMSSEKLDLTEKVAAEKYLNRELTIKLSELDEKTKEMHTKLMAKDKEMIRLQSNLRLLEEQSKCSHHASISEQSIDNSNVIKYDSEKVESNDTESHTNTHGDNQSHKHAYCESTVSDDLPKEDAMLKLQQRFFKIMEEVADLSDEKHRLEHIILQLQNETETICEYVALYQQQRSLLKKRDEERSAQIKIFQSECDQLKRQLEELSQILLKLAKDKELSPYFQVESRQKDLAKAMELLSNLKNNSLVDSHKISLEFKNFYPCNCCSGKLIDV